MHKNNVSETDSCNPQIIKLEFHTVTSWQVQFCLRQRVQKFAFGLNFEESASFMHRHKPNCLSLREVILVQP